MVDRPRALPPNLKEGDRVRLNSKIRLYSYMQYPIGAIGTISYVDHREHRAGCCWYMIEFDGKHANTHFPEIALDRIE